MALAAEPAAVTGKLPGDSGGRGGELFGSQAQNHSKERPRLCPGLPGRGPHSPGLCPACGKEPLPEAQPLQAWSCWQSGQERASSGGRPSWGATLSKPGLCPEIPGLSLSGRRVSTVAKHPCPAPYSPRHSPLPPRPSCPQLPPECDCLASQPPPSPKKPPAKGEVPLTAECMATVGTERIPEQPQGSQSRREAGAAEPPEPQPGLCWPLPAGFTAQHTRSCCDYKRLLWAPSQECAPPPPPIHSQRARTGRWPCPAPLPVLPHVPRDTSRNLSLCWVEHTQGAWLPQALNSQRP